MSSPTLRVFIFGCSMRAESIEKTLADHDSVEIIGYVDNDESKWGTLYLQRKIYSFTESFSIYNNDISVSYLIAPQKFVPIEKQLRALGVERIFVNLYELLDNISTVKADAIMGNGKKDVLLICNGGLPKVDNKYRSAFVYRRLLAYKQCGMDIDAFGYIRSTGTNIYEFEGNQIYEGDDCSLVYLLKHKQYDKIFIHFPAEDIMYFVDKYVSETCKVFIWIHGYEVLKWARRSFNYTKEQIEKNIKQFMQADKNKEDFFRRIFIKNNYKFIFVSSWLKETVREDIGMLPKHYQIIPNYIDTDLFNYIPKKKCDVTKVLLIKSNKTRVYANDVAAKAIEVLAYRECFSEMEFDIYGDGELFEENYKSLLEKNYPNVNINQRFLTQREIAELHKANGIFLCPTRQDTQGVSMCEAMSSGLVVVTNNVAAIPEYINESSGALCGYEDYTEMADSIEKLFYDRELFLRLSENAAKFVRAQCGYDNTIQLEINMFQE
jgi:glycosyltransferase involved in cell wall biosynthesis